MTSPVRVLALRGADATARADTVATEEPLEIRVRPAGGPELGVAVTMRTPGHDFELAAGFLATEGVLTGPADLAGVRYCDRDGPRDNVVTVTLRPSARFDPDRLARNVYTTSSCGVCGKASLEALATVGAPPIPPGPAVDPDLLLALPAALRARQPAFARTGGLHAAGLFAPDGTPRLVREDVGRHNAIDKVVGALLLAGMFPAGESLLAVSGRASFEVMQKAVMAGIPVVVAVGAPSSLAVSVAAEFGVTLAGFVRDGSANVYAGPERIRSATARSSGVSTSNSASGGAT